MITLFWLIFFHFSIEVNGNLCPRGHFLPHSAPSSFKQLEDVIAKVPPWAVYHAEDFNAGEIPEANGIRGSMRFQGGTVTVHNESGNGANAPVVSVRGTTGTKVYFPDGSIPEKFTICSVTRYSGTSKLRILQGARSNWLHGHWSGKVGVAYYVGWITSSSNFKLDDFVIVCGTNGNNVNISVNLKRAQISSSFSIEKRRYYFQRQW